MARLVEGSYVFGYLWQVRIKDLTFFPIYIGLFEKTVNPDCQ